MGYSVWFDEYSVPLGASLPKEIDHGLRTARFAIVVLSSRFFAKKWPRAELEALIGLEQGDGRPRLLPVWHDVTYEDVVTFSPLLASRLAVRTSDGVQIVVNRLVEALSGAGVQRSEVIEGDRTDPLLPVIKALVLAVETRDPFTSGHSVRVSIGTRWLALALGLPPDMVRSIGVAGLLHDVGMIDPSIQSVLTKPYDLANAERERVQAHVEYGVEILTRIGVFDRAIVAAVRHHHERFDGRGYPDGLSGQSIPIAARIIMVVDAIDSMMSRRPYRDGLSSSDARSELFRCSGTQFDPELVSLTTNSNVLDRLEDLIRTGPSPQDYAQSSGT